MLIDGLHLQLATPFAGDGTVYFRKLESNVRRYSLTPAAGLVALRGEGAALSDAEAHEALRIIGSTAAPGKVLTAAITRSSVYATLRLADCAAEQKFDAVLLEAPRPEQRLSDRERKLFFQAVADSSPLPVLLGNLVDSPECVLPVQLVAELSRHENIRGLVDAALSMERFQQLREVTRHVEHEVRVTTVFAPVTGRMLTLDAASSILSPAALVEGNKQAVSASRAALKMRLKKVGFQVIAAGSMAGVLPLLEAGLGGLMPTLGPCLPQACHEVYAAFKDGDAGLAFEKQQRLIHADELIQSLGVAGLKYACDLNGYFGGPVRLPYVQADAEQRASIERALQGLHN